MLPAADFHLQHRGFRIISSIFELGLEREAPTIINRALILFKAFFIIDLVFDN
jgi:hypothetical protein